MSKLFYIIKESKKGPIMIFEISGIEAHHPLGANGNVAKEVGEALNREGIKSGDIIFLDPSPLSKEEREKILDQLSL